MTSHATQNTDLPPPMVHIRDREGAPVQLAMQDILLTGSILPIGARLVIRHLFASASAGPVEAVYSFMLPRDASMRSFKVQSRKLSIDSELMPRGAASELYEEGVSDGRLSILAETHLDGLVNLSIGNLLPNEPVVVLLEIVAGVELRDEGYRFRFPFAVAPVYQPGARYGSQGSDILEIELPEKFGGAFLPPWHPDPSRLHKVHIDIHLECPSGYASISSPSHPIRMEPKGKACRVSLSNAHDVPNRDFILEVALPAETQIFSAGPEFAALVNSTRFSISYRTGPRRIVFLLDRSGSMEGLPLEQAVRAIRSCLSGLQPEDLFTLMAFDSTIDIMERRLVKPDAEGLREAGEFLSELTARGGTNLGPALSQAGRIGGLEAEIFLVTDGQVGSSADLIATAHATRSVVHVLGIGSASQDRFIAQLARATGGISYFAGPREDVDNAALSLFASVGPPTAHDITAELDTEDGIIEPKPASVVRLGIPWLASGSRTTEPGIMNIAWEEVWEDDQEPIFLNLASNLPESMAETLSLFRGARLITDAEIGQEGKPADPATLEALSRKFGLSSTAMSLVAVMKRQGDKAGDVPTTIIVPVGLPQDISPQAYSHHVSLSPPRNRGRHRDSNILYACSEEPSLTFCSPPVCSAPPARDPVDAWMSLAHRICGRIQSGGHLDGATAEERAVRSLIALMYLSVRMDLFRPQAARLKTFIASIRKGDLPDDLFALLQESLIKPPVRMLSPVLIRELLEAPYDPRDPRFRAWLDG